MKTILLGVIMLTISMFSYGQITSFKLISGKEYPNNTRTQYLQLDQTVDKDLHQIIKTELLNNPLITNFSFYDKSDYSMCMYSSDLSIDGDDIIVLINEIIQKEKDYMDEPAQSNFYYKFYITNLSSDLNKEFIVRLINHPDIDDAQIKDNTILTITSIKEITILELEEIVENFNTTITPLDNF